jgi:hypothetical protein
MKRTLIFIISIFSLYSFAHSQTQYDLLEKAYKENSLSLLDSFFIIWQNEIKPISQEELNEQNDTVKTVYELFSYFYRPQELADITDSTYAPYSEANSKAKYAVIQNSIVYRFVDKYLNRSDSLYEPDTVPGFSKGIYEDAGLDSVYSIKYIQNFIPNVKCSMKPVFLNDKYAKIITNFLDSPEHSFDEVVKRYNFLHQMIEFRAPYYSGFTLITWPLVIVMDFTKDFLKARIRYSIDWEYWLMFFTREGVKWGYTNHKHHGSG